MSISKDQLKQMRVDIDVALEGVRKKHALQSLQAANCSFSNAGHFTFQLKGMVSGGLTPEQARYDHYREMYALPIRGTTFKYQGRDYACSGLNTTGTKVVVERTDGKRFQFTTESVKRLCGS